MRRGVPFSVGPEPWPRHEGRIRHTKKGTPFVEAEPAVTTKDVAGMERRTRVMRDPNR